MLMKRIVLIAGNVLPIILSLLVYATITSAQYHLWVWYDALLVPVFLLLLNFFAQKKSFYGIKLLIIPFVIAMCLMIHMIYFGFEFTGTSGVIWLIFGGIALGITLVGGVVLYFISKRLRIK